MGKIGFIGPGAMGRPKAGNLAKKGFDLVARDLRREPVEALAKLGAAPGNGVAGVTQSSEIVGAGLRPAPTMCERCE